MTDIDKVYILGFPKCGSTSLRTYLSRIYPNVTVTSFPVNHSLYHDDFGVVNQGKCTQPDVVNYIIIRDPFNRLWTSYWWAIEHFRVVMSFEDYLAGKHSVIKDKDVDSSSGIDNPVQACDYWKFIKKAERLDPIVVRFEDMVRLGCFPHEAKTVTKPKLDFGSRILIKEAFDREGIRY